MCRGNTGAHGNRLFVNMISGAVSAQYVPLADEDAERLKREAAEKEERIRREDEEMRRRFEQRRNR